MQLNVTGHHVDVTPALHSYVEKKLERIMRHFDQLIDSHFVLTVEKLQHKAEGTLRVRGETIHAVAIEADMYASIDALADTRNASRRIDPRLTPSSPTIRSRSDLAPRAAW